MDDDGAARLWRMAVDGDAAAFEAFVGPALPAAYRLAASMLKDRDAAEDAVQEAMFKAWRRLGRFRPGSPLRPWLLAITANECRTSNRSRWSRLPPFPDHERAVAAQPLEDAWAEHLDLARALDRLPRRHLLALSLYYGLDLPMAEVAAVLGCSEGAARVRVHRAVSELRPELRVEAAP